MSFIITAAEFTGDLRLTLDAQPVSASPPLSDSLDITAELAEVTPAAVPPSDQHPSSAAIGPPVSAGTSSDQSQAKLQLDLPKSSAAGGTDFLGCIAHTVITSLLLD